MSNPELENDRVKASDRFAPSGSIVCPFQSAHPEVEVERIYRPSPSSYKKEITIHGMGPNTFGIITQNGQMYPVEDNGARQVVRVGNQEHLFAEIKPSEEDGKLIYVQNPNITKCIKGARVIPVGTWGERADMLIHFDEKHQGFVDLPRSEQLLHFQQRKATIQAIHESGRPVVYWGANNSPGGIRPEDRGLQSVLFFHDQTFELPESLDSLSPDDIRANRDRQNWDKARLSDKDSASKMICRGLERETRDEIIPNYQSGQVNLDQMGMTIYMPGFEAKDLGDTAFLDRFWLPVSRLMHRELNKAHKMIFGSSLDKVEEYVRRQKKNPEIDRERFEKFFMLNKSTEKTGLSQTLDILYHSNELRHGFGWSAGAQFRDGEGALFMLTPGIRRSDEPGFGLGPVEGLTIALSRPRDIVTPAEEVRANADFFRSTINSSALH